MNPLVNKLESILYRLATTCFLVLGLFSQQQSAHAVRVEVSENVNFNLTVLFQSTLLATYDPANENDPVTSNFNLNLARLSINGQLHEKVSFLLGTGGNPNVEAFNVADAVAMFNFNRAFVLDTGLVLPAFLRHSQQLAANLNSRTAMGSAYMHPDGSTVARRSPGVRARGLLLEDKIDYRFSLTNGKPTPASLPRLTGRIGFNLMDPEPGYIFPGTYFGTQSVVSVGAAFDTQMDIVGGDSPYVGAGADVFASLPMGANRLTAHAEFVFYNAQDQTGEDDMVDNTAMAAIFDLSYMIENIGPVVSVEWYMPQDADFTGQRLNAAVGLNWWIDGVGLALKSDVGIMKSPGQEIGDAPIVAAVFLQTMLR